MHSFFSYLYNWTQFSVLGHIIVCILDLALTHKMYFIHFYDLQDLKVMWDVLELLILFLKDLSYIVLQNQQTTIKSTVYFKTNKEGICKDNSNTGGGKWPLCCFVVGVFRLWEEMWWSIVCRDQGMTAMRGEEC